MLPGHERVNCNQHQVLANPGISRNKKSSLFLQQLLLIQEYLPFLKSPYLIDCFLIIPVDQLPIKPSIQKVDLLPDLALILHKNRSHEIHCLVAICWRIKIWVALGNVNRQVLGIISCLWGSEMEIMCEKLAPH